MRHSLSPVEIERRFLVSEILDSSQLEKWKKKSIIQGYLGTMPGKVMRVRLINNEQAVFTIKSGSGICRFEHEVHTTDIDAGRAALETCLFSLEKTRYSIDGWELDVFEGSLKGLVLLERELESIDEEIPPFPDFLTVEREVTDSITNLSLAEMSTLMSQGGNPTELLQHISTAPLPVIVLTGGPCSGKSTLMREITDRYPEIFCVPEVATIAISHVGLIPPVHDPLGMVKYQRIIYGIQRAFEHGAQDQAIRMGKKLIVVDRGTMDNAAYLPNGKSQLSGILKTTPELEYGRYQAVFCLSQPTREIFDQMKINNPARLETAEQAEALSQRIVDAWQGHSGLIQFSTAPTWEEVSRMVHERIKSLI